MMVNWLLPFTLDATEGRLETMSLTPPADPAGGHGYRNRNRKLLISRAPTKAKSQEPAYSHALNQNKIDRQRSRSRESGRQAGRQSDGYGRWCLELRRGARYGEDNESGIC